MTHIREGIALTELRRSMIEGLQLRGLSARTQKMYVRAVRQLAQHVNQSPDQITEAELRPYFLPLKNLRQDSRRATTMARCRDQGVL
jgi:integrase/recombinase XerD